MKNATKTLSYGYIKQLTLVLVAAIIFPFFIHLLPPYNGFPVGAYLLPMFYIPFIALFAYGWRLALPIALLAPFLNAMITGNPNWEFLVILTLELTIFSCIAYLLIQSDKVKLFAAPLSYIGAKISSSILLLFIPLVKAVPFDFFISSTLRAIPGIVLLLLINYLMLKYFTPNNSVHKKNFNIGHQQ
ncbi:MAG: hypothetical protein ACXIUQ_01410 [Cecembia sp.]